MDKSKMADNLRLPTRRHGNDMLTILMLLLSYTASAFIVESFGVKEYPSYQSRPGSLPSQESLDGSDVGCGNSVFTSDVGEITSPNYPKIYPNDISCEYRISVVAGSSLWLQFTDVSMETSDNCDLDSITLYTGNDSDGALLMKICDFNSSRSTLSLNGSEVFVVFQSNHIGSSTGFRLLYYAFQSTELNRRNSATYDVCNQTISMALSGEVLSHRGYPNNDYPSDVTCQLVIDPGGRFTGVYVSFFDVNMKVFSVHSPGQACPTTAEKIVVSPANQESSKELTVCANEANRSSTAIDSAVSITMYTLPHSNYNYRGFKAFFTQYYHSKDGGIHPCLVDDFYCEGLSRCIPGFLRCDGINHCGNHADERNCDPDFEIPAIEDICNPDEIYCGSYAQPYTTCVIKHRICDGRKNCVNGLDEKSCPEPVAGLSAKAMVGVILGLFQVVVLAAVVTRYFHHRRRKRERNKVLRNTGYDAVKGSEL
ncbi:low-density lipoprotein receptor-related protein 12-like isoform X2 [Ptychodera flava]|uniref:low-density lipoprotein receptor-related protein 12-like isoform X2 n=1 Tax=Ptychodera flava TaxID=63121 RepID=UPI003969BE2B